MSFFDSAIIVVYLAVVFGIGIACARGQKSLKDYFLGDRNIPWWAAACSGVGAIVSGVAYLGAPGLAFSRDFSYHQIRLGIPVAIAVIAVVMLPIFFRLNIYSIYEYLQRRFDRRVRLLASALFLLSKCGYLAVVIYAPSLVVAQATGLPVNLIVFATGLGTMIYTLIGGIKAVIWTDTLQVGILMSGIVVTIFLVASRVPGGFAEVMQTADAAERLKFVDWSFSLTETYTVWGGLIGGTFLLISQFGSNQAEIQRFLTTKSIRHANWAMITSMLVASAVGIALFFIGTTLFGFYSAFPEKGGLTLDPNRVYAKFIIEEMPMGLRGLIIAAVLSASMSAISVVLNSLATVAMADFVPLWRKQPSTVTGARWMTLAIGVGVTTLASFGDQFGNLLEATTRVISLFIGSVTGIFMLGMLSRRITATAGFWGMLAGMVAAFVINFFTDVSFLWLSPISATITILIGIVWSGFSRDSAPEQVEELTFNFRRKE
ncbi:MAG: sodium/solute symporter [Candidatus Didemnitutus sp.]|jgi:SSS family transporter|nr:sodium/solute symporter [Candidatus Didemnitutus sp.]